MTEATDTITPKLERIAELRREIAKLQPLKDELDELKFGIILDMQHAKSKRTEPVAGIIAIRASRKNTTIVDADAVTEWIEANEFSVEEYMKLDEARVKAMADSRLKETGELIPGVETSETEYLTIKESKDK